MKNLILFVSFLIFLSACNNNNCETEKNSSNLVNENSISCFGDSITIDGATEANLVSTKLVGKDSMELKIKGNIVNVCQKKGCWLELNVGLQKTMRVTFKDYSFFVPINSVGKNAILEGYAYIDTTSIEMLKHYAEDAGQTKKEIEAIKYPEISITYEARGVIIKNN